ncbi:MAG TPA: HAD hydrolase-like protein [Promicromonospora sp.]|nr:HAD hydrolase-like protein [Promicromonospora sp.]
MRRRGPLPEAGPDGLLDACRHLGVGPGEAAYVGDAATDLCCARAAGALAVHATWGAGTTPRLPGEHLTAPSPARLARLLGA